MRFDIVTIFPGLFDSFLNETLIKKGIEKNIINIFLHNLRDYADNKHKQVDDRPFGGGAGMVLKVDCLYKCLMDIKKEEYKKEKVVLLSPTGNQFTQKKALEYSRQDRLVFLCGRYEGMDARIYKFADDVVSVGPYILSGGEIPSMIIMEAVSRLLPGFLGNEESIESSIKSKDTISEYPVYTRPESFVTDDGSVLSVPPVLLSGNHSEIEKWREENINKIDF